MLDEFKKFKKLVNNSKEILLITPPEPNNDLLGTVFALYSLLNKEKKSVTIFDNSLNNDLKFLQQPPKEKYIDNLNGARDFLLIFNTKYNKIINVHTEQKEEETVIRITPEKGAIDPRDFSFAPADFKYDLVIAIGAPTLESLGKIYQENTDLFFEVPKININNDSENDDYGQINLADLTASATAEIVADLFFDQYPTVIDKDIAQSLLTGIISTTDSFQSPNTTPQTLLLASRLVKMGADQAEIIKHLYRTKPLSFLKLWGRVMARLNWDDSKKYVWSLISTEDFLKSRASEKDIPQILEELRHNYTRGKIFGIFYSQDSDNTHGEFFLDNSRVAKAIAEEYQVTPSGNNHLKIFFKNKNLIQAEKDFQTALNKNL